MIGVIGCGKIAEKHLAAYRKLEADVVVTDVVERGRMVAEKARQAVSSMLEVAPDDLELVDGAVRVKGADLKRTLGEVAHALQGVAGFST